MSHGSDPVSRARFPETAPDEKRVEKLTAGVPLAKLIKREMIGEPEIVMLKKSHSLAAEKFHRLKTVLSNDPDGGPQVVVITSAAPSEGKSVVATNLALAFAADSHGKVLIIDADLRRPTLGYWVSPAPDLGLTEVLNGTTEPEHTILELKNSPLHVLPAGIRPHDPVALLSSPVARDLIADLRKKYKRIIIDTPPILPFADADAVGGMSDGVLMVARAGRTRRTMFQQAVQSVTSTRVLGVVLNDTTYNLADRGNYGSYSSTYYDYYEDEGR